MLRQPIWARNIGTKEQLKPQMTILNKEKLQPTPLERTAPMGTVQQEQPMQRPPMSELDRKALLQAYIAKFGTQEGTRRYARQAQEMSGEGGVPHQQPWQPQPLRPYPLNLPIDPGHNYTVQPIQQLPFDPGIAVHPAQGKQPYYTGTGADKVVQPLLPTKIDKIAYHEGEVVIPAGTVQQLGGGRKATSMIKQAALQRQAQAPNVRGFDTGGIVEDEEVKTPQPAPSTTYAEPTPVSVLPIIRGATSQSLLTKGIIGKAIGGISKVGEIIIPPKTPEVKIETPATVTTPGVQPLSAPPATPQQDFSTLSGEERKKLLGSYINFYGKADGMKKYNEAAQKAATGEVAVTEEQKRKNILQSYIDQYGKEEGLKKYREAAQAAAKGEVSLKTPVAKEPPSIAAEISEEALARQRSLMDPNSEIYKKIAATAFGNLDPQLQTQMTVLAMQIASDPDMTEGQKRTAMAQGLRDVGIAQAGLAEKLASNALTMATNAIGKTYEMAEGKRRYDEEIATERERYRNVQKWGDYDRLIQAGDFDNASRTFTEITGKPMDADRLKEQYEWKKNEVGMNMITNALTLKQFDLAAGYAKDYLGIDVDFNDEEIANAMENLSKSVETYGEDTKLSDPGVEKNIELLKPGSTTAEKEQFLKNLARRSDLTYLMVNKIGDSGIRSAYGKDADGKDVVDTIEYRGLTGIAAARAAITDFINGAGVNLGTGELNDDAAIWDDLPVTWGGRAGKTPGTGVQEPEVQTTGTVKIDGRDVKVGTGTFRVGDVDYILEEGIKTVGDYRVVPVTEEVSGNTNTILLDKNGKVVKYDAMEKLVSTENYDSNIEMLSDLALGGNADALKIIKSATLDSVVEGKGEQYKKRWDGLSREIKDKISAQIPINDVMMSDPAGTTGPRFLNMDWATIGHLTKDAKGGFWQVISVADSNEWIYFRNILTGELKGFDARNGWKQGEKGLPNKLAGI